MYTQLHLPVHLPDDETFESFVSGDNQQLLSHLDAILADKNQFKLPLTYISGDYGVGKSHLLFATCHSAQLQNKSSLYLSFKQKNELSVDLLEGLEHTQILCIDDVQLIKDDYAWQVALFNLINRVKESGACHLLITADAGPKALLLQLADLQSRLTWGVSYQLQPLNEQFKLQALEIRAARRGLKMPEEVAHFLLTHLQRDMPVLMATLDKLDQSSLQQKRKLTIPFVKQVLGL